MTGWTLRIDPGLTFASLAEQLLDGVIDRLCGAGGAPAVLVNESYAGRTAGMDGDLDITASVVPGLLVSLNEEQSARDRRDALQSDFIS